MTRRSLKLKRLSLVWLWVFSAVFLICHAAFAQPGSIYWSTSWQPCGVGFGSPMVSGFAQIMPCILGGTAVSICPGNPAYTFSTGPWEKGQPITITSASVSHIMDTPSSYGYFVLGSDHGGGDGPDVFLIGAGMGSYNIHQNVNPFPQGADVPGSHIDLYAHCATGNHMVIVDIEYVTQ